MPRVATACGAAAGHVIVIARAGSDDGDRRASSSGGARSSDRRAPPRSPLTMDDMVRHGNGVRFQLLCFVSWLSRGALCATAPYYAWLLASPEYATIRAKRARQERGLVLCTSSGPLSHNFRACWLMVDTRVLSCPAPPRCREGTLLITARDRLVVLHDNRDVYALALTRKEWHRWERLPTQYAQCAVVVLRDVIALIGVDYVMMYELPYDGLRLPYNTPPLLPVSFWEHRVEGLDHNFSERHVAREIENKLYLPQITGHLLCWDQRGTCWDVIESPPLRGRRRYGFVAHPDNACLYVIGGETAGVPDAGEVHRRVSVYNTRAGRWAPGPALPPMWRRRFDNKASAAFSHDGNVVLVSQDARIRLRDGAWEPWVGDAFPRGYEILIEGGNSCALG